VSFAAMDGGRVSGWFLCPDAPGQHPALVFHHGYTGDRGRLFDYLVWVLQGFAVFTVDVRGQNGASTDGAFYPGGRTSGWLTLGILEPKVYYFTRVYLDTVRAVDYVLSRPETDPDRVGVAGVSQGGGLSLAAAALTGVPRVCLAAVPGFCHFPRTLEVTRAWPWGELAEYFRRFPERIDTALRTLSYVDIGNLADRVTCPTLMSAGLLDDICIPSGIYSVYNGLATDDKHLTEFPWAGHEAGGMNRDEELSWARRHLMPG
jgi:cephalosporin-C deacetylase